MSAAARLHVAPAHPLVISPMYRGAGERHAATPATLSRSRVTEREHLGLEVRLGSGSGLGLGRVFGLGFGLVLGSGFWFGFGLREHSICRSR